MTTHGDIEIHDSSTSYLLHAYSDGHMENTAHALLMLPAWVARKRHASIAEMQAKYSHGPTVSLKDFLYSLSSYSGWSGHWAGDVTAALIGFQPLWWVPWNYKEPPPYFHSPDFHVYVTKRGWRVVGELPLDWPATCFNLGKETLQERIADLNQRLQALPSADPKPEVDETLIAPFLVAAQHAAGEIAKATAKKQIKIQLLSEGKDSEDSRYSLHIPAYELWLLELWEMFQEYKKAMESDGV